jgi:hypothetical protein
MGDLDQNGLSEVYCHYGDSLFAFEQASLDSLPKRVKFRHRQWHFSATGIPNQIDSMTNGPKPEMVYRGSEPDTIATAREKTYVVRFDSTTNNLVRIWSAQMPPGCEAEGCTGAIATGDFDGDGKMEFATSNFAGNVYVVEHVGGDSFAVVWSTTLSVAGRAASGDVDGNGITEFFIGGTQPEADGYVHLRAFAFERTTDNTYQPIFRVNIFPAGVFFVDLYQTSDVDGDGVKELLLSFAGGIAIIKGAGEHNYELFYYRPVSSLDGLGVARIGSERRTHLFVSRFLSGQPVVTRTDIYRIDSSVVVGVKERNTIPSEFHLLQNFPNPFNPITKVRYLLSHDAHLSLRVYDTIGREVQTLVDGHVRAGEHEVTLDASSLAGGVYFYRLQSGSFSQTRKLLILK